VLAASNSRAAAAHHMHAITETMCSHINIEPSLVAAVAERYTASHSHFSRPCDVDSARSDHDVTAQVCVCVCVCVLVGVWVYSVDMCGCVSVLVCECGHDICVA